MQFSIEAFWFAGDGRGDAEKWIIRIDGPERADFLHMVRTATGDCSGLKDTAQWLEVAEAFTPKLFQKCVAIQIKPGGLDIKHYTQASRLLHRLAAHEIGMTDARQRVFDRHGFVHFLISVEKRVDGPVTDRMRGVLQAGFDGGTHHGHQTIRWNESDATIIRVTN